MRIAVLMAQSSGWSIELVINLQLLGHEIHAISFDRDGDSDGYVRGQEGLAVPRLRAFENNGGILHKIRCATASEWRYVTGVPAFRRILSIVRPDGLLALYGGGYGTTALLSGFRPYAVYAVGSDVHLVRGFKRAVTRRVFRQAGCVFANGARLAEAALELAPGARVLPLYMGVVTSTFTPGSPSAAPVRILCTRGFESVYNNEYLIQGLAAMHETPADYQVRFLAPGPLLARARTLADDVLPQETRRRVLFLGGMTRECVREELQAAHVYVSLSHSDGTSTSLLEALSCGLFPVLSDIPANREWVDARLGNGVLVPFDEPTLLGQALAQGIGDVALRMRASTLNRALVIQRGDSATNLAFLVEELARLRPFRHGQGLGGPRRGMISDN